MEEGLAWGGVQGEKSRDDRLGVAGACRSQCLLQFKGIALLSLGSFLQSLLFQEKASAVSFGALTYTHFHIWNECGSLKSWVYLKDNNSGVGIKMELGRRRQWSDVSLLSAE